MRVVFGEGFNMNGYEYDYRSPVHRALSGGADRWMDKPRPELATAKKAEDKTEDKPQSGPDEPDESEEG